MRVFGRNDAILLGGLLLAAFVVFSRYIQRVLDLAREVEEGTGLMLVPALLILAVVFLFHQQGKRQETKADAAAAAAAAQKAQERATELERLVTFGQALARSLDLDAIHDVAVQQLWRLAANEDTWVLIRLGDNWEQLVGNLREGPELDGCRELSVRALSADFSTNRRPDPVAGQGHWCVPMVAGGVGVGVLGVPEREGESLSDARRRVLSAAAALLAISIKNAELFKQVHESSLRDGLTGCFNRMHALETIDIELRRARRTRLPVSLIMCDLDHFKDINDRHGHLCGDAVLAATGARVREVLRGSDLKCRFGGEEFLFLLPETPLDGANRVADMLLRELGAMSVLWKDEAVKVTASFGVTAALPGEVDSKALIARADAALYRAKSQGRNCVCLATEDANAVA